MDEVWADRQAQADDIGECAFWFQVERARAAPAESGATSDTEQELTT